MPEDIEKSPESTVNTPSVPPASLVPVSTPAIEVEEVVVPSGMTCAECGKQGQNSYEFIYDTDNQITYCRNCGKKCSACDKVGKAEDMHFQDRYWYCQSCFDDEYISCPNCSEIVNKDKYLAPTQKNKHYMKHGGCTECAAKCSSCDRVVDNDHSYSFEGEEYCEDCYGEHFTTCEECGDTIPSDDNNTHYVEYYGNYCTSCYNDKFTSCHQCGEDIEDEKAKDLDGEKYCDSCYPEASQKALAPFTPLIENMLDFTWSKKDRLLDKLFKIIPISVRELKAKHSSLANSLKDLITFTNGKDITLDIVNKYRESQGIEDFPVEYGTWTELQRSIEKLPEKPVETPQLVIKIIASPEMLSSLKSDPSLYNLFDNINTISNKSTHPYSKDQVGWARLELDPNKNFILVDEIQCDHQNAAYKLKTATHGELAKVRRRLKNTYRLDDNGFNNLLDRYNALMKNFPDIATAAVSNFAKKNGYARLYWHTYESGKALKDNDPPKSLYDKVPKENFFLPTEERPFNLPGQFLSREASQKRLKIAARRMALKHLLIS